MKQITLFFLLMSFVTFAGAQDRYGDESIRTIFSKNKTNGFYGAFSMGWSRIDGKDALVSGGRAAIIFDHTLAIGLGGYGFVNNLDYRRWDENIPGFTLAGGYGGIFVEPIVGGKNPVHLSFPILVGLGGVSVSDFYGWDYWEQYPYSEIDQDLFFVVEPAAELEFNMTRWFRLAASVGYRYTSRIELMHTTDDVMKGLNVGLVFKFGKF